MGYYENILQRSKKNSSPGTANIKPTGFYKFAGSIIYMKLLLKKYSEVVFFGYGRIDLATLLYIPSLLYYDRCLTRDKIVTIFR